MQEVNPAEQSFHFTASSLTAYFWNHKTQEVSWASTGDRSVDGVRTVSDYTLSAVWDYLSEGLWEVTCVEDTPVIITEAELTILSSLMRKLRTTTLAAGLDLGKIDHGIQYVSEAIVDMREVKAPTMDNAWDTFANKF